jgi:hypothetical protein
MQIGIVRYKPLTAQEKNCRFGGGLYLYCGENGHNTRRKNGINDYATTTKTVHND